MDRIHRTPPILYSSISHSIKFLCDTLIVPQDFHISILYTLKDSSTVLPVFSPYVLVLLDLIFLCLEIRSLVETPDVLFGITVVYRVFL